MPMYENSYIGFRVDIPDNWNLVCWKNAKLGRSWRSAYQTRDDDLPKEEACASKFLFTAALYAPEGLVDADIEISIFRLAPGEDFRMSLVENFERQRAYYEANGITTSILKEGEWTSSGVDFGYMDEESVTRKGKSRYRFLYRRMDEVFWLYGKIAGHKEWAFEEALKIVAGMKWYDARSA